METIKIYTDGACSGNPGPGGWSVIVNNGYDGVYNVISGGHQFTTNNRMELVGVINALQYIIDNNLQQDNKCIVCSDSAYVINGIQYGWLRRWKLTNWKTARGDDVKNADLWKQCEELLSKLSIYDIQFVKVKGHDGEPLNEYADRIAKQAAIDIMRQE